MKHKPIQVFFDDKIENITILIPTKMKGCGEDSVHELFVPAIGEYGQLIKFEVKNVKEYGEDAYAPHN